MFYSLSASYVPHNFSSGFVSLILLCRCPRRTYAALRHDDGHHGGKEPQADRNAPGVRHQ